MVNQKIVDVVKLVRDSTTERKFKQSFDLCVNFKLLDVKKPEGKVKKDITLPHGTGKEHFIGIIADTLVPKVTDLNNEKVILIKKADIEALGKDKKKAKALANKCKVFLAEAPMMPLVAKALGPILAPRGKMPKPVPPTISNLAPLVASNMKVVHVAIKGSPVIHCTVGSETLDDQKIAENIEAVVSSLSTELPRGKDNIRDLYLKMTMSKGIKFKV